MKKIRLLPLFAIIIIVVGLICFRSTDYKKMRVSMVIFNGEILAGEKLNEIKEAIALSGDKILALGSNEEIQKYIDQDTKIIDAQGRLVCPGFTDSHLHFLDGGQRLASVDLRNAKTPAEFVRKIEEYAETIEPGVWILGGDWDHTHWGGDLPEKEWIDKVTPKNPVWVSRLDGHMALANSLALKLAKISRDVEEIEGGTFVRNEKGELTGILKDNAMALVENVVPEADDAMKLRYLRAAMDYVLSKGVTSVHHMGTWDDVRIFENAKEQGELKVRISAAVPIHTYERLKDRKETKGWGDEWLRLGGLKGFMDGSLGSHTALMKSGYTDSPEDFGLMVTDEKEMYELVKAGDEIGGQAIIHAIGDSANHIVLNIYEKVEQENGSRDRRFRIEHAQHLLPEDLSRFAELNVIASMQPYHCIDDGRWAEPLIGQKRMKTTHAYRSLLNNEAFLVFGSDWFVAPPTPLEGIYAAVTRATLDGKNPSGWVPEEKITVKEALTAYTVNPPYASFEEKIKGTLEPGKLADIVILDRNILTVPPEEIWNAKVDYTIVGGKVMYRREN